MSVSGVGPMTSALFQISITCTCAGTRCRRVRASLVGFATGKRIVLQPVRLGQRADASPSCRNSTASASRSRPRHAPCPFVRPRRHCRAGRRCRSHAQAHLRSGWSAAPCRGWCRRRRHDGQLGTRQRIEQGRLAGIGLAGNHDLDAFTQQGALARLLPRYRGQAGRNAARRPCTSAARRMSISSSGKSSVASTSMRRSDQRVTQFAWISAEKAPDSDRTGAARSRLGAGVDQVGNGLGLGQIHLVVQERALGEFAWLRQATQVGCRRLRPAGSAPAATAAPPCRHAPAAPARPRR
jgi:hypothetical protein